MEYKDIKKLMDDMGDSKLDSLEIEFPDGVKISMTKNSNKEVIIATPNSNVIEASAPMTVPTVQLKMESSLTVTQNNSDAHTQQNGETNVGREENLKVITSPMVGTFYASASPEKPPFVKVGDRIHKGQVVCIVEAMKLMNEIESEYDGEVVEVCVNNEDVVEYGKPLFKLR